MKHVKNLMKNDKNHRTNDKTTIEEIHKPYRKCQQNNMQSTKTKCKMAKTIWTTKTPKWKITKQI